MWSRLEVLPSSLRTSRAFFHEGLSLRPGSPYYITVNAGVGRRGSEGVGSKVGDQGNRNIPERQCPIFILEGGAPQKLTQTPAHTKQALLHITPHPHSCAPSF